MHYKQYNPIRVAHFKRFLRRGYSAFCVCRVVSIGVLTVSTLSSATITEDFSEIGIQGETLSDYEDDSGGDARELAEVHVVTTISSLSDGRPARVVRVITGKEIAESAAQSTPDLLKLVSSIDVRQRGAAGVQTDIGIDGGTHDQVTVMLNGVNITTPQVGHYNADWPVNLDDIECIEILEGASSRILGGSSLMGAINVITKKPQKTSMTVNAEAGSYGSVGAAVSASAVRGGAYMPGAVPGGWASSPRPVTWHNVSGAWKRSDGGTVNSDYHRAQAYYRGGIETRSVDIDWQAGASDMAYGANTFYSAAYPNQHDAVSKYLVSMSARTKGRVAVQPMAYWMRHSDHYQLVRDTRFGENYHRTDVIGGRIHASALWRLGYTSLGAEMRDEHLLSTALGKPLAEEDWVNVPGRDSICYTKSVGRTSVNLYAEHNAHFGRFDLSAGLIMSMNTGLDHHLRAYPGVDLAYNITSAWRLSASWSKAYRMPTFTDLYYKSVAIEGNKDLQPERMQSTQLTLSYIGHGVMLKANGFWHKGHDMIDWVMYTPDDIYHSTSFDLENLGVNVRCALRLDHLLGNHQPLHTFSVDYTQIHQKRLDDKEFFKSNYALEYPRHKLVVCLTHDLMSRLTASWSCRYVDRCGSYVVYADAQSTGVAHPYSPYAVLDLRLDYAVGHWLLYLTANNLTNHRYYDFGNIPQPGLWIMGGVTWRL